MNRNRRRRGFSLIELLIVIAIILIIVTVALPKLNKARMYAQETAALKAIQTINTAQVQYNSQYGRFATSLTELGPPTSGADNPSAAGLISGDLAGGEKQGYRFTMAGTPAGYTISAVPTAFGSTGSRTFFSDQSLVIRENYGQEPATVNSREVGTAASKSSGDASK
ncbi:MAG: prepilin-type N-terminal cleavage/methylation domain-containing protein [Bryobacteraceae bacterium]